MGPAKMGKKSWRRRAIWEEVKGEWKGELFVKGGKVSDGLKADKVTRIELANRVALGEKEVQVS